MKILSVRNVYLFIFPYYNAVAPRIVTNLRFANIRVSCAGNKYSNKEEDDIDMELNLVRRAQHIMRPFVLRRRKDDV